MARQHYSYPMFKLSEFITNCSPHQAGGPDEGGDADGKTEAAAFSDEHDERTLAVNWRRMRIEYLSI